MTSKNHPIFLDGVVSMDGNQGIGYKNDLLIRLKEDMKWFRHLTTEQGRSSADPPSIVIMGRKTWESIPIKFKPLPGRVNYILSRQNSNDLLKNIPDQKKNLIFCFHDWNTMLDQAKKQSQNIFIIGGREIFTTAITLPEFRFLYVTKINAQFTADVFFPPFLESFTDKTLLKRGRENHIDYEIIRYRKIL